MNCHSTSSLPFIQSNLLPHLPRHPWQTRGAYCNYPDIAKSSKSATSPSQGSWSGSAVQLLHGLVATASLCRCSLRLFFGGWAVTYCCAPSCEYSTVRCVGSCQSGRRLGSPIESKIISVPSKAAAHHPPQFLRGLSLVELRSSNKRRCIFSYAVHRRTIHMLFFA